MDIFLSEALPHETHENRSCLWTLRLIFGVSVGLTHLSHPHSANVVRHSRIPSSFRHLRRSIPPFPRFFILGTPFLHL